VDCDVTAQRTTSDTVTVQRIVDFIENAYAQRITLKSLAGTFPQEPEALARMFKLIVGTTIHEYLTRVRLDHAAHLISHGVKIEAVALNVGYQSKKNFYRQFSRQFGVTPQTYGRRGVPARCQAVQLPRRANGSTRGEWVTYAATFDGTACVIDVQSRLNVKGASSFAATPFVVCNHGIQPFATTSEYVEILGETEQDALDRAAVFLQHRFGSCTAAPTRQNGNHPVAPILAPRR
jgi:AraC-like DNA-binding protein